MIKEAFILNYNCGNFSSLRSWLKKADVPSYLLDTAEEFDQLTTDSLLILPGVGHFKTAHDAILKKNFRPALEKIYGTTPILGICLGVDIMFESSAESPSSSGLGWFKGNIKPLPESESPRLGWYETRSANVTHNLKGTSKNPNRT